jgi:hypothetical protein
MRRALVLLASLTVAVALWLPSLHLFFRQPVAVFQRPAGVPPKAEAVAARHLTAWSEPALLQREIARMRRTNAEWDFMGRTFFVLALCEMAVREPARQAALLGVVDRVIAATEALDREQGPFVFLMPYARYRPYLRQPARSLFVDGEIALMLAARRLVEERVEYREPLAARVGFIVERMQSNPLLAAESYPDECWLFDHSIALAALRASDRLEGTDHRPLAQAWLAQARRHLIHRETGILVSAFTTRGEVLHGPEGSSIWVAAHFLRAVDPDFARDQYRRARQSLSRRLFGFAWSREWPTTFRGPRDVDSGAVIPFFDVSAGASGNAFVGAAAFGDLDYLQGLHATLDFSGFPSRDEGALRYCASNFVGDAVLMYSGVVGPLWDRIESGSRR